MADTGRIGDQGVVVEAWVGRRVAHFHHRIALDGVGAERQLAWGFRNPRQADVGLPPLPTFVHQRDQCDGGTGDRLRGSGQRIEERLGGGVDHLQQRQTCQALGLAGRR